MITLFDAIRRHLEEAGDFHPEDIAPARERLRLVQAHLVPRPSRPDRSWWRWQAWECEVRIRWLGDFVGGLPAVEACLRDAGARLDLRDRILVESALIHLCLESQPLPVIKVAMESVYSGAHYRAGYGLMVANMAAARLAERRGCIDYAREYWTHAWRERGTGPARHLHGCEIASHLGLLAARRGDRTELEGWIERLDRVNRSAFLREDFRLATLRLLGGLDPLAADDFAGQPVESPFDLRHFLPQLPERIPLADFLLEYLYALARAGQIATAADLGSLIPAGRRFERALWAADRALFEVCALHRLPTPHLHPLPGEIPSSAVVLTGRSRRAVGARLSANYHHALAPARKVDARLRCRWRQQLVADRLRLLNFHSDA